MSDRKCPECGERLSFDSLRCACGWGVRKGEKLGKVYDHRCTYVAGSRCDYPVGMFPEGATQGWCIFHRQSPSPQIGALIVEQSKTIPYAAALGPVLERSAAAPGVVNTAHAIALHIGNREVHGFFDGAAAVLKRRAG